MSVGITRLLGEGDGSLHGCTSGPERPRQDEASLGHLGQLRLSRLADPDCSFSEHHRIAGSILLQGDQASLAELGRGVPTSSRSASLGELIGDASSEVVGAAVARSMQEGLPGRWEDAEYTASEVLEADRLEEERYREDSWTWRL